MASVHDWSPSAGSNATGDAAINWAEGMLPSGVNNSARQMMARIAERLSDESPIRTSTGAANLYSFNITSPITEYKTGLKVSWLAHQANSGASQISVNGIGFKPLRRVAGVELGSAAINLSKSYTANYILATDEFLLEGSDLDGNSLNSPAFTGVPTAPTATAGNSTTQLATTAFTSDAINALATSTTNALALKANLNSPALTGAPTAPTAAAANASTQLATTGFVHNHSPPKLSTAVGTAPSYSIRARVTYNGASGAILADLNVTSVTDLGTGVHRVNFTTGPTATTYSAVATARTPVGVNGGSYIAKIASDAEVASAKLTSSCVIISMLATVATDAGEVDVIFIW